MRNQPGQFSTHNRWSTNLQQPPLLGQLTRLTLLRTRSLSLRCTIRQPEGSTFENHPQRIAVAALRRQATSWPALGSSQFNLGLLTFQVQLRKLTVPLRRVRCSPTLGLLTKTQCRCRDISRTLALSAPVGQGNGWPLHDSSHVHMLRFASRRPADLGNTSHECTKYSSRQVVVEIQ